MKVPLAARVAGFGFGILFWTLIPWFPPVHAGGPDPVRIAEEVAERIETPHPYARTRGMAWSATLSRPGASYIAVHFERFDLAPGDELVLRDPGGRYVHRYRGRGYKEKGGDFWGLSVLGDTMILELHVSEEGGGAYGIVVDRWAHGFPQDHGAGSPEALCGAEDFLDIECYKDTYPTEYERGKAVVRLIKNGSAHCTGWIASCENHIVTNEHCVGSQAELDQIEFQFEYKRPNCGAGTPTVDLQLQGGTLLETDAALDYALILPDLAGNDPASTYGFLQWDVRLPNLDETMYIVHHPSGDPKRLSVESTHPEDASGRCEVFSTSETPCTGGPGDIGYFCDTEGGSSGSPVLSAESHQVIALHHCANCPNRGVPIEAVYNDLQNSANPLPACSTCNPPTSDASALSAAAAGDNRIDLDWTGVPDAAEYRIYRSRVSCDAGMESIGTSVTTLFTDTTAAGGVTYYYRVAAVSDCGAESGLSNCASAVTTGPCIEPPEFAGVASATNGQTSLCAIELAWDPAQVVCGTSAVYNVYRSTASGFVPDATNRIAACVSGTSYRDTGVAAGVPHYYVVRAEDDSGDGAGPCAGGNEEGNVTERAGTATGPENVVFRSTFESDEGWILDGEWERAAPLGLGGNATGGSGDPDPAAAWEGGSVLGVDLTGQGPEPGNYEDNVAWFATSPAVDIQGLANVHLRFQRWLGVEDGTWDQATVETDVDGGGWIPIWQNSTDGSHSDGAWVPQDFDLTQQAQGGQSLRIRFGLDTDTSVVYCGWNVDALEVYEVTACTEGFPGLPPVPDGNVSGGQPMRASRSATDGWVDVSWDVTSCPGGAYHLYYGDSDGLPQYAYDGAACFLDPGGSASLPIPDPAPGHFTWWLMATADGTTGSHHGHDSSGTVRPAEAGGLCGVLDTDTTGTCGP